MRRSPRLGLALLIALLAACGRHEAHRSEPAPDSTVGQVQPGDTNPADASYPSPPQPAGPQIGKSDSLINAIKPQLDDWVVMWRETLPGFLPESLWSQGKRVWKPGNEGGMEGGAGSELTATILTLDSPGGRYSLCIDNYQYIQPDGDTLIVGGDPESQPSLTDNIVKRQENLAMCGTSCGFHWAKWLSPTSFALGSWTEADEYGQWKQGRLTVYSIRESTRVDYATRIVSVNDYDRYYRAWTLWLLKRYHEIMKAHPKT
jgi:hypothetical protein